MQISVLPFGPLSSNMYILEDRGSFFVIDPSVDPDKLDINFTNVKGIIITHGHFDHICYVDKWVSKSNAPVYMSPEDFYCLDEAEGNLSSDFGYDMRFAVTPTDISKLESDFDFFKVIKTPGHSKGSVCIILESDEKKFMFSGDMLFAGSVGRTDFNGSNPRDMVNSIRNLKELPSQFDDMVILPGHGESTTLNEEKLTNPYFN